MVCEKMNKKNFAFLLIILFMTIGYASYNTTVNIYSKASINFNDADYRIYLSSIHIGDTNLSDQINENGDEFTINPSAGASTIIYRVKNISSLYDGNVTLTCTTDKAATININQIGLIEAHTVLTSTITLSDVTTDTITCKMNVDVLERTEAANEYDGNADTVEFTSSVVEWKATTVKEALDDLRERIKK